MSDLTTFTIEELYCDDKENTMSFKNILNNVF
jgi:hypothetical protein